MFLFSARATRKELATPDVARVTPYLPEVCLERLQAYAAAQPDNALTELDIEPDEDDPDVWYFSIMKTFYVPNERGGMSVKIVGQLVRWGPDDFTKVRAAIRTDPGFVFLPIILILVLPLLLFLWSAKYGLSPITATVIGFTLLCLMVFWGYRLTVTRSQAHEKEFVDEIKTVLHKVDGSIE